MKSKVDAPPSKDGVLQDLIPKKISPCALHTGKDGVCMNERVLSLIEEALEPTEGSNKQPTEGSKQPTEGSNESGNKLEKIKSKLGCKENGVDGEICVLNKARHKIGQVADLELKYSYKIDGPTDSTLANNINLDTQMQQWAMKFKDFYAYNFNMRNYHEYSYRDGTVLKKPDTLATIQVYDLFKKGYRCAGCIINTDYYQGGGIHWMCLFVDLRNTIGNEGGENGKTAKGSKVMDNNSNDRNKTYSVEFFNSSGNNPTAEWTDWMVRTKLDIERLIEEKLLPNKQIDVVKSSKIRHQRSKTECGLYSLFYIWARLRGVSWKYFMENPVPDSLMFEFRQHLFKGSNWNDTDFDWQKYKKAVNVQWE